jgi:ATP synthase protein I
MVEPTEKGDPKPPEPVMVSMARYSGLGLQLAASVVIFMLAGRWLDGKLGTGNWLTLVGAMMGGAAGFYSLYRHLVKGTDHGQRK